jgi:anaerobic ribonucleoside-triphosphate reductase activating protein
MLKYYNYDIVFQEIPNEVTLAINLSNCPNHCKGCHSPWLAKDIGEPLTKTVIIHLLNQYGNSITCVCLMGGDAEPKEVEQLGRVIRDEKSQLKVGWYSGKEKVPECVNSKVFQYIKLGGYIESLGGLRSKTTNQRLYKIKENGEKEDLTYTFWK